VYGEWALLVLVCLFSRELTERGLRCQILKILAGKSPKSGRKNSFGQFLAVSKEVLLEFPGSVYELS
jgi:hypothetical protein